MIKTSQTLDRATGAALFAVAILFLYWVAGDVLRTAGDEGIYLQGGRLVAEGEQPYRDFFTISGPLSFWIEGALAFLSGGSLAVMRLPPILDAAFLAWVVYYLISRYADRFYSSSVALAFLAYETRLRQLNVNHRWDSAALAMGAILLAGYSQRTKKIWFWAVSGFLIVAAAWSTFSVLIVAIPLLFWSGWRGRGAAMTFLAGGALAAGTALIYLQTEHALLPMIASMRWTAANYTQANRISYGGILGGAAGVKAGDWLGILGFAFWLLPVFFPMAAVLGWSLYFRWSQNREDLREIAPLLAVAAALVLSAWPRWTSDALLHTLGLSWFLCALLFYRLTNVWQQRWVCAVALLLSFSSMAGKTMAAMDYGLRETRVGNVRASLDESEFLARLEHWVQPGDSLFSFPYLPSVYYFLDARNPTYYSIMQPGMMTPEDEQRAISELQKAPPKWVIYENFPPEAVLTLWPGSDPARLALAEVSSYLHAHYQPVETVAGPWGTVQVMTGNAISPAP